MHAVTAQGLVKAFGDVVALDGIDIEVPAGQVRALVGPNGAGKTTFLSLLLGLSTLDAGSLEVLGQPVTRQLAIPAGVAGFVDAPGLYPSLTARQNLRELNRLQGRLPDTRIDEALERVGLSDVADDRIRGFSLGMRQRLGLASAMLGEPRLLVLDEPVNGLDPAGRRQVHEVIADLAARGTAVIVTSHRMEDLERICSEVTILDRGRIAWDGPLSALAARDDDLDHRLVTSDPARTRVVAAEVRGLHSSTDHAGTLVVNGPTAQRDELLARLVTEGIAIREYAPVIPVLEAAFLALTSHDDASDAHHEMAGATR